MKRKNKIKNGRLLSGVITACRQVIRFIFSRYFITLAIILIELLLVEYLLYAIAENLLITTAVVFVLYAVGTIHLINRDANPEYKITWLLVMVIPFAGVLLYFLFYDRRLSGREVRLLMECRDEIYSIPESTVEVSADSECYGKIRSLMADDTMALPYGCTTSRFFSSGEEYFDSLIADLAGAKRFIFLEYFIIEEGELWSRILDVLKKKVRDGVEVRILYDDIGCMQTLPSYYEEYLHSLGISAHRFGRVTPRLSSVHNNRDHRKIAVIDGNIGYTGGVNIADEYANIKEKFGYWKDGGIRVEGHAARGLMRLFLVSYDFTSGAVSDYSEYMSHIESSPSDGGIYLPFGSGPPPVYSQKSSQNLFLNIINQAKKYVYITTPYLIIDYELTEALCKAARRGVSVKIVTPDVADKKIVKIMTKSSYPHLKQSGVEIYEYLPGFIHEKTLISDDEYLVVGTINLDYRSLAHHFEDGIFVVKSPVVLDAKRSVLETIELSDYKDNMEARLTPVEWALRNIIKIFAPLL